MFAVLPALRLQTPSSTCARSRWKSPPLCISALPKNLTQVANCVTPGFYRVRLTAALAWCACSGLAGEAGGKFRQNRKGGLQGGLRSTASACGAGAHRGGGFFEQIGLRFRGQELRPGRPPGRPGEAQHSLDIRWLRRDSSRAQPCDMRRSCPTAEAGSEVCVRMEGGI